MEEFYVDLVQGRETQVPDSAYDCDCYGCNCNSCNCYDCYTCFDCPGGGCY